MNSPLYFNARDLSAFAKSLGWVQVEAALKDGLYVFNHADLGPQLVFARDKQFADAQEMLCRAVDRLAQIYELSPSEVERRVEEFNSEILVARVPDEKQPLATIPFLYAMKVMESHKELMLAGAMATGRRQTYYPKTFVGDAKRLLEAARFRHTEPGSFILKTSCRLYEFDNEEEVPLIPVDDEPLSAPFVRRAMLNVGIGLEQLIRSVHQRSQNQLIESIQKGNEEAAGASSPVSANFCDAVAALRDREHPRAVELSVKWSPLLPPPPQAPRQPIQIVADDFPIIEEVAKALRPLNKPKRDTYLATVEKLEGTFNDMGQRQGRVLLSLLRDGEKQLENPILVRVTLDAPKYEEAVDIHRTTRVMARVEGTIRFGQRQPFEFDLEAFRIISVTT